jgi:hypothetical protein
MCPVLLIRSKHFSEFGELAGPFKVFAERATEKLIFSLPHPPVDSLPENCIMVGVANLYFGGWKDEV